MVDMDMVDMVANMKVYKVDDIKVNKVANMKRYRELNGKWNIYFGEPSKIQFHVYLIKVVISRTCLDSLVLLK